MKTNIFWPRCLWQYSCRGSESTLESTYTSSISKVVNGRIAHQGTTISMCSCFRDASFSFCHLSLSKVKKTSQVILFLKYSHKVNRYQTAQIDFLANLSGGVVLTFINSLVLLENHYKTNMVFDLTHWLSHTLFTNKNQKYSYDFQHWKVTFRPFLITHVKVSESRIKKVCILLIF